MLHFSSRGGMLIVPGCFERNYFITSFDLMFNCYINLKKHRNIRTSSTDQQPNMACASNHRCSFLSRFNILSTTCLHHHRHPHRRHVIISIIIITHMVIKQNLANGFLQPQSCDALKFIKICLNYYFCTKFNGITCYYYYK